jgi:predicted alpha/beta-fold hydrolase
MRFKIAVREALPFQEIQQTPFAVLCTTTLGGHLSWFELGGTRWFAKPVSGMIYPPWLLDSDDK